MNDMQLTAERLNEWADQAEKRRLHIQLEVIARRDEIVRSAAAAGFKKADIHRLSGLARTTIDRILDTS